MIVSEVTPPSVEPVLLADLKTHLNIDSSFIDDDSYIETLQVVARRHAEVVTRRKLISQTWQYFLQEWPDEDFITIPFGSLQSITHCKYTGTDDVVNTDFDENDEWTADTDSDPGRLVLKYGKSFPSIALASQNAIELQFVCGYGDAGSDVPDEILMAIKLMVSELYENREMSIKAVSMTKLDTFSNLLASYRLWW